jgi:hypothetical protein
MNFPLPSRGGHPEQPESPTTFNLDAFFFSADYTYCMGSAPLLKVSGQRALLTASTRYKLNHIGLPPPLHTVFFPAIMEIQH